MTVLNERDFFELSLQGSYFHCFSEDGKHVKIKMKLGFDIS